MERKGFCILLALVLVAQQCSAAPWLDGLTLELGAGSADSARLGVGASRDWPALSSLGRWRLGGRWAASLSYWNADEGRAGDGDLIEVGLTPVLRCQRSGQGIQPYVEAGIGVHLLSDTGVADRQLSTAFHFGTHLGLGLSFGPQKRWSFGYAFQHLSNAGIKRPNPGMNFHLLRLSRKLR